MKHMKQLHPRAVWLFFVSIFLRWFFVFLFLGIWIVGLLSEQDVYFNVGLYVAELIIFAFITCILIYIWARLSYHFYKYELIKEGFRKESGVIYKKYVTIPYNRIQNVDIYRGIWARILGLSDLEIQTAGSSARVSRYRISGTGAEGKLPGLLHKDAEKLRDELIKRARESNGQGL